MHLLDLVALTPGPNDTVRTPIMRALTYDLSDAQAATFLDTWADLMEGGQYTRARSAAIA